MMHEDVFEQRTGNMIYAPHETQSKGYRRHNSVLKLHLNSRNVLICHRDAKKNAKTTAGSYYFTKMEMIGLPAD